MDDAKRWWIRLQTPELLSDDGAGQRGMALHRQKGSDG